MPTKENNAGQQQPYDSEGKFTNFSSENAHPKKENGKLGKEIDEIVNSEHASAKGNQTLWDFSKTATPEQLEELKKKGFTFETKKDGEFNNSRWWYNNENAYGNYIYKKTTLEDGREVKEVWGKQTEATKDDPWYFEKSVEARKPKEAINVLLRDSSSLENQDVKTIKSYIKESQENEDRMAKLGIVIDEYGFLNKITENYDKKGGRMVESIVDGEKGYEKAFYNKQLRDAKTLQEIRNETEFQKNTTIRKKDAINKYSDIKDIDTAMKFLDTKENEDAIFENLDDPLYEEPSFNKGGGYSGRSMSNRAVLAYEAGQRPKTKWTKEDFMDRIADVSELEPFYDEIEKMSLAEMKDNLLERSSWHHTGAMASATNFYGVISPRAIYQYLKDKRSKKFANFKKKEE